MYVGTEQSKDPGTGPGDPNVPTEATGSQETDWGNREALAAWDRDIFRWPHDAFILKSLIA